MTLRNRIALAGLLLSLTWLAPGRADDSIIRVGMGSYATALPPGVREPQDKISKTENFQGPVPTNRWWSSLAWMDFSERQFPHPLAVKAERQGLRVFYPGTQITVGKSSIMAGMPGQGGDDLVLGHSAQADWPDARLDAASDWFVRARFASGNNKLTVSYGHGSPYVYALYEGGSAKVTFGREATVWSAAKDGPTLGVTVGGKHYGLFGPAGSRWSIDAGKTCTLDAHGKPYCSIALLPAATEECLALFAKHAHAHVVDTQVKWSYEPATSAVRTTFQFTIKPYEGDEKETLFALYPHQWQQTDAPLLDYSYNSVRGLMKLGRGASFVTRAVFPGVLPAMPLAGQTDPSFDRARLDKWIAEEAAAKPGGIGDTYNEGKWMGKTATLIGIAEQTGNDAARKQLTARLRERLETWLSAVDDKNVAKRRGIFYYNQPWGTLIGYPAGFGSDTALNDHHFHYGYFLQAAARIAREDRAWAADDHWGGMVKLLARDAASPDRQDRLFPFLRCYDPYAGHSWASGNATFGDGNNQESSSEAMNAWCGLILWGEATGDRSLRDLGIWLFTSEMTAINAYWFDVRGENRPKDFPQPAMGILWGGKADYSTWFSGTRRRSRGSTGCRSTADRCISASIRNTCGGTTGRWWRNGAARSSTSGRT